MSALMIPNIAILTVGTDCTVKLQGDSAKKSQYMVENGMHVYRVIKTALVASSELLKKLINTEL